MRLKDKVAIITGGGSGIGAATSLRFAEEGAAVVVADVNTEGAEKTVAEIKANGGQAISCSLNVADKASCEAATALAVSTFGKLNILINNAGIVRDGMIWRKKDGEVKMLSEEKWDMVLSVNLKGAFLMIQACVPHFINAGGGAVVSTASVAVRGNIGQSNYSSSKAGLIGLTRTLSLELARYNIRLNVICPGATDTAMFAGVPDEIRAKVEAGIPLKRMATPREMANVHLFLASDEASYVTGQDIFVDAGVTLGV